MRMYLSILNDFMNHYKTDHITTKGDCCISQYEMDNKVVYFGLSDDWSPEQKKKLTIKEFHLICKRYEENKKDY